MTAFENVSYVISACNTCGCTDSEILNIDFTNLPEPVAPVTPVEPVEPVGEGEITPPVEPVDEAEITPEPVAPIPEDFTE
jgi:hypothetical protein